MRKKTHNEFMEEISIINPNIHVIGTYVNCSTKIQLQCKMCQHLWEATPNSLLQGHGCPSCAQNQRKSLAKFVEEMQRVNQHIEVLDDYHTAKTPMKVKCRICGNVWRATPNRLLNGAQCQKCVKPHTSFMEQFILVAFCDALGEEDVESRNTTEIGQELDIYIPKFKLAIEPGTWLYHQAKACSTDLEKRIKCKEKGVRLVTIYDTYPKGEEPPFDKDCYVFEGFLNEPRYRRLVELIQQLMGNMGINYDALDWPQIADRAYSNCHYNAHENFMRELAKIAPDIQILEEFKGTNVPIAVKSTSCNHPVWKARPYTLLNGHGCPLCGRLVSANTRTRSPEEFVEELNAIDPSLIVLGEYTKVTDRINVACRICGHNWTPLAYSLLSGKGCPHCSAKQGAQKRTNRLAVKTTEQFKRELVAVNSDIKVISEYINNKTKMSVECALCGHRWDVVPASLLNGHGCPQCARKRKR